MMLSGNLTDWSVGDLLQMLHITKKTASLHVTGTDRYGVVHFEDGAIVNADVSLGGGAARDPKDEVAEAIYVLELLDEGAFEIKGEVPSRTIDPISVAEALELAGQYLTAERHLDETGLLAARGLRLAQTIDEPIILSEQVWNAISGSIPAFTFPELEERMGRAAAVATVEQFRDLGILEAVLGDTDPTEGARPGDPVGIVEPTGLYQDDSGMEAALVPSTIEPADLGDQVEATDLSVDRAAEPDASSSVDHVEASTGAYIPEDEPFHDEPFHDGVIVPVDVEEIRPIVSEAPASDIVVEPAEEPDPVAPEPVPTQGVGSLSAAIRAAAGAGSSDGRSDDESALLTQAAAAEPEPAAESARTEDGSLRRTVRSLVSEPGSPLSNGMLGDLGARFRQAAAADED